MSANLIAAAGSAAEAMMDAADRLETMAHASLGDGTHGALRQRDLATDLRLRAAALYRAISRERVDR